ncbi:MAG: hypothetical protein MI865_12260 [Proteobacteria bacterium]|nr:hypothetical protein [Pseudomonadota bacterium]
MSLETVLKLDNLLLSCVIFLLAAGLILVSLGFRRLFNGKILLAGIQGLSGTSIILLGLLLLSIASNLYSYQRLTFEQPIAELRFTQNSIQQFHVNITYLEQAKTDHYMISGDEWQVDARIIKWQGWATLLGLNAQYRLERISGRYSDIDQERSSQRTVYTLSPKEKIDYWKLINKYKNWLPWVDAYYGSATYLPMKDNTAFLLSVTQTGLIARPLDDMTTFKVEAW